MEGEGMRCDEMSQRYAPSSRVDTAILLTTRDPSIPLPYSARATPQPSMRLPT